MIVGENITENMYLESSIIEHSIRPEEALNKNTYFVVSSADISFPSGVRVTRSTATNNGIEVEVTNNGIA